MGNTPVRRLTRKQRERLKRQKEREELYRQEEDSMRQLREEKERQERIQQRASHLRILALEDNDEQINQFLKLMKSSGGHTSKSPISR